MEIQLFPFLLSGCLRILRKHPIFPGENRSAEKCKDHLYLFFSRDDFFRFFLTLVRLNLTNDDHNESGSLTDGSGRRSSGAGNPSKNPLKMASEAAGVPKGLVEPNGEYTELCKPF